MKKEELRGRVFLSSIFLLVFSCARTQPVDFKAGEYACEFCQMDIVDLRFKAEILSPKGKVHRFDSIECMMGWARRHPGEVASRWVGDFYRSERWIALEKAFFLKSERLASPMGAFLSAYATSEGLSRALEEYGGKALDLKALENYIEQQWQKEVKVETPPSR